MDDDANGNVDVVETDGVSRSRRTINSGLKNPFLTDFFQAQLFKVPLCDIVCGFQITSWSVAVGVFWKEEFLSFFFWKRL